MAERLAYVPGTDATLERNLCEILAGANGEGIGAGPELKVTAGTGLQVSVAAGRAIVSADVAWEGSYLGLSTAAKPINLTTAHATQYRTDIIVAQVRDAAFGDAGTDFTITKVDGTPSVSNPAPAPNTPTRCLKLAEVRVNPGATVPSLIVDTRVLARERREYHYASGMYNAVYELTSATDVGWGPYAEFVTPVWAVYADVTFSNYGFYIATSNGIFDFQGRCGAQASPYELNRWDSVEINNKRWGWHLAYRFTPPQGNQVYRTYAHRVAGTGGLRVNTSTWWMIECTFIEGLM